MPEQEPFIEVEVRQRFRVSENRYPKIFKLLSEYADLVQTEVIPPEGEPILFELPPTRDEDPSLVTLNYFRRFYKDQFEDDIPSALPKRVFDQAERTLDIGDLVTDGKGNIVAIRRPALEALVENIRSGESKALSGPKTRKFLFALVDSLPELED
jgi:hypothetical protein